MGCCKSPFKGDFSSSAVEIRVHFWWDRPQTASLTGFSSASSSPNCSSSSHGCLNVSFRRLTGKVPERKTVSAVLLQISSWRQKYTHAFIRLLKKRVREGDANLLLLPCSAIMETQSHTPPKGHRPHEPRFSGCARQQSCNRTYLKLQTGRTSRTNLTENKNNTPIRSFKTCQNPKMSRLSFILFLQRKQLFYRQNF